VEIEIQSALEIESGSVVEIALALEIESASVVEIESVLEIESRLALGIEWALGNEICWRLVSDRENETLDYLDMPMYRNAREQMTWCLSPVLYLHWLRHKYQQDQATHLRNSNLLR
jgi:hypothetical protein